MSSEDHERRDRKRPRDEELLTITEPDFDYSPIFEWGKETKFPSEARDVDEEDEEEARDADLKKVGSNDSDNNPSAKKTSKVVRPLPPVTVERAKRPLPTRSADGTLHFADFPEFRPNLTPKEVLQMGSFGGTYFRPMVSRVNGQRYSQAWREFPPDWFEGLDISTQVASPDYLAEVNCYRVACSGDLKEWEDAGWVTNIDPYGYFQWYCRFYLGRRCTDDHRQITRANNVMGPFGRWRRNLINKCVASGLAPEQAVADTSISPKIRQLLLQWGYQLTLSDLRSGAAMPSKKKRRQQRSAAQEKKEPAN